MADGTAAQSRTLYPCSPGFLVKNPLIGIWWDDGTTVVSFSESVDPNDARHGISDSDFAHNDCWPEAATQLSLSPDTEYFDVPRGRVLWHASKSQSIILHGNYTSVDRLKVIAEVFQLENWSAETDLHYMMGDVADGLFDDD